MARASARPIAVNAGNRMFGWFCLFIAITALPTGIYTLNNADGNIALLWLGSNWLVSP